MADDPLAPVFPTELEAPKFALATVVYAERGDGQILLLKRAEGSAMAGAYFMPGGVVDPGEEPFGAARRELAEESGLAIDGDLQMVGCYPSWMYGHDFLLLSFRGRVVGDGEVAISDEHEDARWADPHEMRALYTEDFVANIAGGDERIESLLRNIADDLDRYLTLI